MSSQDLALWSSIPWTPVHASSPPPQKIIGYHKPLTPYLPSAHPLQTLDIWIAPPPSTPNPPPPAHIPLPTATTRRPLAFIHGGAWRDPSQTATACFAPAALHLLANPPPSPTPACYLSLSYRLSPSASRPDNTARHPDHISDVLAALAFLRRLGITPDTLVGHSCGATLAVQAVLEPGRWGLDGGRAEGVKTVVGVNGLWDLDGVISGGQGGEGWDWVRGGYEEFVKGAFGGDSGVWRGVSPGTMEGGWGREWEGAGERRVWLVRSRGDGLVPKEQGEVMRRAVEREGVEVGGWEVEGGHDEVWERGEVLGGVVRRVLRGGLGEEGGGVVGR